MTAPRSFCTRGLELASVMATGESRATMQKLRDLRAEEAEFLVACGYDDRAARFLSTSAVAMIQDEARKLDLMARIE